MTPTNTDEPARVYDIHVFCCINERAADHPRSSCSARGAVDLHKHMKIRTKTLGIKNIRVNKAGCLDRCELGPVMVIYPEGTWYTYASQDDIDEIIDQHIIGGKKVERLLLQADQKIPVTPEEPRLKLRVAGISKLVKRIKRVRLIAQEGEELPAFTAGSHLDVFVGNGMRRSYSLANDPADRDCYEIAILREVAGRGGSAWLHDNLAIGDDIETSLPKNLFPIDENASRHVMIAGGIGITPILSMGRHLKNLGADTLLHYCARGPESTAYAQEAKEAFGDNIIFHHDGGDPARGIDLDQVLADPQPGTCIYACGPAGLLDAVLKAGSHWPENSIRIERFAAAEQSPDLAANDEAFEIVLSRRGMNLTVPPGKTILQVIRDAGIDMDSSCEGGICGTCQVRLLGGEVDHRDSFLSEPEKAAQRDILICSSRAAKGETLILDI